LAFVAAGMIGLFTKGIGERAYRFYLEQTGVVLTGEVVGHRLYRCGGILCSRKIFAEGGYGSAGFNAYLERCVARPRSNCHTDLVVGFNHDAKKFEIDGPVDKRAFGRIEPGSFVAVLVNREHPEESLLRDHNPEGFLFWVALILFGFVLLLAGVLVPPFSRTKRRSRRSSRWSKWRG
jgi:hypothetical protein